MNLDTFLGSIITATSILIAVGIPLIIYFVTEHKNKRERLLHEMKVLYPKLNLFRELIYRVSLVDFWKEKNVVREYNAAYRSQKKELMKDLNDKNEFLTLHSAYQSISKQYTDDVMSNSKRIFTYKELSKLQTYANIIWYSIDCRTDIIGKIDNNSFNELNSFDSEKIRKIISKIDTDYSTEIISIRTIASISGDMEVTVIDSLCDLAWDYERPLDSIVKKIYVILTISLAFCVIAPLFLLLFSYSCSIFYLSIIIVALMIICFVALIFYTGKYIEMF